MPKIRSALVVPASVAAIVVGVALVLLTLVSVYASWHNGAVRCMDRPLPSGVPPEGGFSADTVWWPVGLRCSYSRSDGSAAVVAPSDWGATVALYGGMLLAALGVVVLLVTMLRRRR